MLRGKVIPWVVLAILAGFAAWEFRPRPEESAAVPVIPSPRSLPVPTPPSGASAITVLPIATEISLNGKDTSPQEDLSTLDLVFSTFRKNHGGNPVGENEEITATLLGKNSKQIGYLPPNAPFVNAKGQLVDRWGTPYAFHSIAADRTDIRSAGPDKQMWTDDDVVFAP